MPIQQASLGDCREAGAQKPLLGLGFAQNQRRVLQVQRLCGGSNCSQMGIRCSCQPHMDGDSSAQLGGVCQVCGGNEVKAARDNVVVQSVSPRMSDQQMMEYSPRMAKLGVCWQFITLAGLHANALVVDMFTRDYARRGVLAYVERILREERNNGVDTFAHLKCSGANYHDRYLKTVQGGISSTASMGKGVIEEQFEEG